MYLNGLLNRSRVIGVNVGSSPTSRATIMKDCKRCDKLLPISDFSVVKSGKRVGKVNSYCRQCMSNQSKERQRELKRKAVEFKGGFCEDCGKVYHQVVYDFHHKNPSEKDFTISEFKSLKWCKEIEKELDKCVLLCSNCHRLRHLLLNS